MYHVTVSALKHLGENRQPTHLVSTVTPDYRGEKTLETLALRLAEIRRVWRQECSPFEFAESIFVDDDSVDGSPAVLERLAKEREFVRLMTLTRNFDKHSATLAGMLYSPVDWVVTLDEDLQHCPEDIAALLETGVTRSLAAVAREHLERPEGGGESAASRLADN